MNPLSASQQKLASAALSSAQGDPALAGMLPAWLATLINLILPGLPALFTGLCGFPASTSAVEFHDHLSAGYDESTCEYTQGVLGPVVHDARVKARRGGNPITISQARAVATHVLDASRHADVATVQLAIDGQ